MIFFINLGPDWVDTNSDLRPQLPKATLLCHVLDYLRGYGKYTYKKVGHY